MQCTKLEEEEVVFERNGISVEKETTKYFLTDQVWAEKDYRFFMTQLKLIQEHNGL